MHRILRTLYIVWLMGVSAACNESSNDNDSNLKTEYQDPYAALWDVGVGEIACNEDSCCFKRCGGNQDTICVTRNSALILSSLTGDPFPEGCKQLVFPEWFYNLDCFVGVGGFVNAVTGEELKYVDNTYTGETGRIYVGFLQCFCGRTAGNYSSEYSSSSQAFLFADCDTPMVGVDLTSGEEGYDESFVTCDNPCNPCTPQCGTRVCGSDGCGGSCGNCSADDTCSAAGLCVSEQDTCSACLSSCRGLPSCCTGCGCICESACGQCF